MLYRNYKKRLERIAKIIDFVKKHKVSILCCIGTLFALIIAFVSVRGTITSPIKLNSPKLIYGQEVSCEASALFRKVSYEHKLDGESEWEEGLPEKAGKYLVRGCSRRAFGIMSYTEEVALTIVPKHVEISPSSEIIAYGEKPLALANLNGGDTICQDEVEYLFERAIGKVDFEIESESVKIINEQGEDVTFCYQITTIDKAVAVRAKQVKLTVDDAEKVYDGQALTSQEYSIGELAFDDEIEISFSATQTLAGYIINTPEYKILSSSGENVTSCYSVQEKFGKLTVSKRPITIKVKDRQEIYDATEFTCNDYEIVLGDLVDGHSVGEFSFIGSRINAGSQKIEFDKLSIIDAGENDVSGNYQITRNHGQLTILSRQITVDAQSQKVYDAKILSATTTDDSATLIQGSLASEHVLVVKTASDSACEYDKWAVVCVVLDGENSVTHNYTITLDNVLMVIARRDVVFTAESDSKAYNATPLSNSGYTTYNLVEGHEESVTVSGSITDCGVVDNVITCNVIKQGQDDVTGNYNIICEKGTLEITKRPVKVWGEVEKVYDDTTEIPQGTLTMFVFKVEDNGTETAGLYGEQKVKAEFMIEGDLRDKNTYAEGIVVKGGAVTIENGLLDNYDITCLNGSLVVNARKIIITTGTGSKVYNGQAQIYDNGVTVENLVAWHEIKYKDWTSLTNVDNPADNTVKVDKIYSNGNELDDKTANYEFEEFFVWGKFSITPRPLISEIELEKIYDDEKYIGTVDNRLFNEQVLEINKLVNGHYIEVDSGDYVDVATYSIKNGKLGYEIYNGTTNVTRNYSLTEFDIKASITKRDITIYAPNVTKTYDALAYEKQHNDLMVDNLVNNHLVTATVYGLYQDVRDDNNSVIRENTLSITRLNGEDVINNYNVLDFVNGELVINKRPVKVWGEVEKVYDDTTEIPQGTLTMFVFKVEDNGTETAGLYGEQKVKAEFMIEGDLRDKNTYAEGIVVKGGAVTIENGLLDNYDITCLNGSLVVNARKIIITTGTGSKVYNGQAQIYDNGVTVENLVAWHEIKYKDWTSLTNVDNPADNTVKVDKIYSNGNELDDKTANYEFEEFFVWGKFSITPRPLISEIELEKIYDDEKYIGTVDNRLFNEQVLEINKLVNGHYIEVDSGDYVDVATYSIKNGKLGYEIYNGTTNVTRNYSLTEFDIKASITKRDITIYAPNVTKTYDALAYEKQHNDLMVDNLVNNHLVTATVYGLYASVKAGNYTAVDLSSIKITRANGTEVTGNYNEAICVNGQMTINKRPITVRIDCEKIYDDTNVFSQSNQQVSVQMFSDLGVLEDIEFIDGKAILYAGQQLTLSAIIKQGYECIDAGFYAGSISSAYTIMLDGEIADADATSYVDNYEITVLDGNATIHKRAVTLIMEGKSKPYDRTALTNGVIKVKEGGLGLVDGHNAVINGEIPSIDYVGKIDNDIPFAIKKGDIDKTHNYDTSDREIGQLEITKAILKVRIYTRTRTYNGTAQQFDVMTVKVVEGLLAGDTVTGYTDWRADGEVVSGNAVKDVGSYQISTTPVIDVSPDDKYYASCTDYYNIQIISGAFVISRCKLTIKTLDIEKAEAIMPNDIQDAYNISGGKVPEGESVSVILGGSQMYKGSSSNKVDYIVVNGESFAVNGDGKYECGNYEITIIEGTLTYK